jgi:hypothetical protein
MPKTFLLRPEQFLAHARTTISDYSAGSNGENIVEEDMHIHFSGRKTRSLTLGKMPNRQINVYDKRREVIHRRKFYMFDIWNIDREDSGGSVWRVEVRAGKRHLNYWKIKSFLDLNNQFGDLVSDALQEVRYLREVPPKANVSRLPLHPLWHAVRQETSDSLLKHRSGIVPERIIEGERSRIAANYNSLLTSILPGALIANGNTAETGAAAVVKYLSMIEKTVKSQPDKFAKKLRRAEERLHFTTRKTERR